MFCSYLFGYYLGHKKWNNRDINIFCVRLKGQLHYRVFIFIITSIQNKSHYVIIRLPTL